jgi:hypothetical protein
LFCIFNRFPTFVFLALGLLWYMLFPDKPMVTITSSQWTETLNQWRGQYGVDPSPEQQQTILTALIENQVVLNEAKKQGLLALPAVKQRINDLTVVLSSNRMDDLAGIQQHIQQQLMHNDTTIQSYLIEAYKQQFIPTMTDEPSLQRLEAAYAQHKSSFVQAERRSFDQVYYSFGTPKSVIEMALAELIADNTLDPSDLGERFIGGVHSASLSQREVANDFGEIFARSVFKQPAGHWYGPVDSAYGHHLVIVTEVIAQRQATFDEAKTRLISHLQNEANRDVEQKFIQDLVHRYDVQLPPELEDYRSWQ